MLLRWALKDSNSTLLSKALVVLCVGGRLACMLEVLKEGDRMGACCGVAIRDISTGCRSPGLGC